MHEGSDVSSGGLPKRLACAQATPSAPAPTGGPPTGILFCVVCRRIDASLQLCCSFCGDYYHLQCINRKRWRQRSSFVCKKCKASGETRKVCVACGSDKMWREFVPCASFRCPNAVHLDCLETSPMLDVCETHLWRQRPEIRDIHGEWRCIACEETHQSFRPKEIPVREFFGVRPQGRAKLMRTDFHDPLRAATSASVCSSLLAGIIPEVSRTHPSDADEAFRRLSQRQKRTQEIGGAETTDAAIESLVGTRETEECLSQGGAVRDSKRRSLWRCAHAIRKRLSKLNLELAEAKATPCERESCSCHSEDVVGGSLLLDRTQLNLEKLSLGKRQTLWSFARRLDWGWLFREVAPKLANTFKGLQEDPQFPVYFSKQLEANRRTVQGAPTGGTSGPLLVCSDPELLEAVGVTHVADVTAAALPPSQVLEDGSAYELLVKKRYSKKYKSKLSKSELTLPPVMAELLYLIERIQELRSSLHRIGVGLRSPNCWIELEALNRSFCIWRDLKQVVKLLHLLEDLEISSEDLQLAVDYRSGIFQDSLEYPPNVPETKNNPNLEPGQPSFRFWEVAVFRISKAMSEFGIYSPLAFHWNDTMGTYLCAISYLPRFTLVSEYAGVVEPLRWNITGEHDSNYELLVPGDSDLALLVVPDPNTNIARFIAGINNADKKRASRQNVVANRVRLTDQMRILLWTSKEIEPGAILFMDYNGDQSRRNFPTEHFA